MRADLWSVYLGDRLGWYASLRDDGPASAEELASRTSTSPRYAREWLEQQAVTGLLDVTGDGRFLLPPAVAEALTDTTSLAFIGPLSRMLIAPAAHLPALLEAYRTGGGVSWEQLGADARESQADMNRPWYESVLPGALAGVPHLHAALGRRARGSLRSAAAVVGPASRWRAPIRPRRSTATTSTPRTVRMARANVRASGLEQRVDVVRIDAAGLPENGFDAVFAFECLHDMPYPVEVLAAARRALVPDGVVIVMDEAVAAEFRPDGDLTERLMYGFSLLVCLPDGMAHPASAGTGTVMRESTLRAYGLQAGFQDISVLPIENFGFWRFYQLRPDVRSHG